MLRTTPAIRHIQVLFNNTIMYNVRYARPEAPDAEVYEAARVAQIHSTIVNNKTAFKRGYNTKARAAAMSNEDFCAPSYLCGGCISWQEGVPCCAVPCCAMPC